MFTNRRLRYSITPIFYSILIYGIILQGVLPRISHAASNITPDGTMGTTISQAGSIYNIDGGTIKGTNQFHSFGLFSVGTGDTASFNGPPVISNIIGRVTGGQQSLIDGLLKSTITGANLYLLNPAGVLFGPNASLDVTGSFHISTGDYLKLSDGGMFYTNPLRSSILTIAPPNAFGFLSSNVAPITIQGSNLVVPKGQTLSVVGGDIQINSAGVLKASQGQIYIASVASPGEAIPNLPGQLPALDISSFTQLGVITELSEANITVSGIETAGVVLIRGGRLVMDNASINANSDLGLAGKAIGINVQLEGDLVLRNNAQMLTYSQGVGPSGDIRIKADTVEMFAGANFYSLALGTGNSGDIGVETNSLGVKEGAYIGTETHWTGNSGNITLNTSHLNLMGGPSFIFTGTNGPGNSGKLEILSDEMSISGSSEGLAMLGSYTAGAGNAGDLTVRVRDIQILSGSELSSTVYRNSSGNGGTIAVAADRVFISGRPNSYTGIFANTFGQGKGGTIDLTTDSLEMTNHASVQAGTLGTGNSGNISLKVGTLDLKDASYIASSGIFGVGAGNTGNIEVTANRVAISGLESSAQPFSGDVTGIFSQAKDGNCGNVLITADGLTMTNRGTISASSYGMGAGGDIKIDASYVEVLNGSNLISSAFGPGNGGRIEVNATGKVSVSGVHPEPYTDITGNESLSPSGIASQAGIMGGRAGGIQITTDTLTVTDGGRISTETFGPGHGGNIGVKGNSVLISGMNETLREFFIGKGLNAEEAGKLASASILAANNSGFLGDGATGNAGNVFIQAKDLQLNDHGLISTRTTGPGTGGTIDLISDRVTLSRGALISSESSVSANAGKAGNIVIHASSILKSTNGSLITAAEQARGGDITLQATQVKLINGTLISAESSGVGDAGDIDITTNSLLMRNSSITTEAKQADGGNIHIQSGYMDQLIDSKITASVGGGPDTVGGNITIDPQYVILNDSQIIANAYEGKGGNIRIIADVFLASPESVVDASSALGIDGTVDIQAPISSISGTLAPMQGNFLLSEALLQDRCMAKIRGEKYSSLIVSNRDGLPIRPGSVLPSPIY